MSSEESPIEESSIEEFNKLFQINYGPLPSQATIRTSRQFVSICARYGAIELYMFNIIKMILEDIEINSSYLKSREEYLMLRGLWINEKGCEIVLYIDLIHDASIKPTLREETIKSMFHNGTDWYDDRYTAVEPCIVKEFFSSESFYAKSDKYYKRLFWIR